MTSTVECTRWRWQSLATGRGGATQFRHIKTVPLTSHLSDHHYPTTIPPLLPTPSHHPQLTPEHVVDTIRRFGRHYDKRLIYDQIRTTLSQICKSHTLREIYITKYDSLDERLAEKLSE